jgi:Cd2+/Zn2+-exporting ATPase
MNSNLQNDEVRFDKNDEECSEGLEPSKEICASCDKNEVCGCVYDEPCGCMNEQDYKQNQRENNTFLLITSGVIIIIAIILVQTNISSIIPDLMLVSVTIIVGYPLALKGVKSLLNGNVGINLLVTIAAIGATIIGEHTEGALVVFLFSISLRLEKIATNRARHAIKALIDIRPDVATIRKNGAEEIIPVEQVLPGEIFLVKPGDRIPLDGVVIEGETTIDQSTITGESVPVEKGQLDDVFAGTINIDGFLAVKTKRISQETMLASILRMVQEAEGKRSSTETFVNRFAKYYTPLIIILAAIVALIPPLLYNAPLLPSIYNSLVLLVIGCPCALTIATPVAMVSTITSASRNGVLIKGSTFIEEMNEAKAFMFDKTGTLTVGKFEVAEIIPYGVTSEKVLSIAAALERKSKHPIAIAIIQSALEKEIPIEEVTDFKSQTGKGVDADIKGQSYMIGSQRYFEERNIEFDTKDLKDLQLSGNTVVLVSSKNRTIGLIGLMDKIRKDAKETINALKREGLKIDMLTGDNEITARAYADLLGFNGYHANLLPSEKVVAIEAMKHFGRVVMIGDGVNDAPALASADIGVAMGGLGSDIALETADIVLLEDDLSKIGYLRRLSRLTMNRIKENIAVALLVKLAIVLLGAFGLITLWMAVIIGDVGLTVLVILNSIRISATKP